MIDEPVSKRECARQLGVSEMAVRKGIKTGRLKDSVVTDARGRQLILVAKAKEEWDANRARTPPTGSQDPKVIGPDTLAEAQRMAALERTRKVRIENDKNTGLLIDVKTATKEAFEAERIVREGMLNIPARIAAELGALTGLDTAPVYRMLDTAIREALSSTAERLKVSDGG